MSPPPSFFFPPFPSQLPSSPLPYVYIAYYYYSKYGGGPRLQPTKPRRKRTGFARGEKQRPFPISPIPLPSSIHCRVAAAADGGEGGREGGGVGSWHYEKRGGGAGRLHCPGCRSGGRGEHGRIADDDWDPKGEKLKGEDSLRNMLVSRVVSCCFRSCF